AERLAADEIDGHWHRFFIVRSDEGVVGTVDLYQHSGYIVSAGPEIFPPFRRRGYAFAALAQAYGYAQEHGFRLAQAQIRADNEASVRLHEKLGFIRSWEHVKNRHGNEVYIYSKIL
ncbi:MAG: GNAT family N-acetyltransferase, partial [Clostridiales bacterium]|nr:GNAT family N-acetyltransferase [Clostridiales bacterium]